jgi:MHS family metabolite:H+ symporter-like MFS transporter
MEFMEFQLYSIAAGIVFNRVFFPNENPAMGLIMAMGTYGAGYVARLLGAFIFGRIGDKMGRRNVLFATIMLMGLASTLIGFLPTYQEAGILAPLGLVVLRILQGFGAGAEISGAGVMIVEFAKRTNRGFIGSLVCLGTATGTLLANLIWAIILGRCSDAQLLAWGWRIPFYASFVIMVLAVLIRLLIKESPVMAEQKKLLAEERAAQLNAPGPKKSNIKPKSFLVALGLRFGQAGNSGLIQTYSAGFIVTFLGMEKTVFTNANIISSLICFLTVPFVGWLGDKVGRRKMYIVLSFLMMVYSIPMLLLWETRSPLLLTIAMVIGLNVGVQDMFALENVMIAEIFGSRNRMTLMALAKEVGSILPTGFGPVIAAILVAEFNSWIPLAVMLIFFCLVTLVSAVISRDVTGRDLATLDDSM